MRYIVLCFCFCLTVTKANAQLRAGFENNSQWYVDDNKIKLSTIDAEERFRSNSYLKVDYDFRKWTVGVQLEGYMPKALLNYSPEYDKVNIGTAYINYRDSNRGIDITAGHFYEQIGSGLLFRAWEDRQLGVNNAVLGLNVKYDLNKWGKAIVFGGKQRVGMGFDLSKSYLFGADFMANLENLFGWEENVLAVGVSYFGRSIEESNENKGYGNFNSNFAVRADYSYGGFYFGAEYVNKGEDYIAYRNVVDYSSKQGGQALLVNAGYSEKGMSVALNLRRIENMGIYSERELTGNIYLQGVVNYVPALTKQYDYSLQNIYVYQAQQSLDFFGARSGEIGGQLDFFYSFPKNSTIGGKYGTSVSLNGAYFSGLKSIVNYKEGRIDSDFLGFGEKYYHDLGIEIRKKWTKNWSSVFMYLDQYYNARVLLGKIEDVKTNIVSAETTYQFLDNKSIRLELQHMWANADKKNWVAGTVEFALNSKWSVYGSDMYNYGNDDSEKQLHYYNIGTSYTRGVTRISASYGRQRGGLVCVGGVCRYVSEAAGLTIGVTTSI
ncbi:DUF6029 family protein [Myroides pelagicus]|uniref:Outer membrane beta-barrel protein n=1 Tax=Myroides pelagicus TaxID=270914 RepID=A0A7K1GQ91_9FLAO|nr:DUF6029 family protein [Myroides pelagicus]MEC4113194.1 DUF6029 family protein [Myroides pelagicus]MTH31082.1 hypothetical protein [Myroides pelagicus]